MNFDKEVDACGLACPLPILRAKKALSAMDSGMVLRVLATDPGSVKDFEAFARQTGGPSERLGACQLVVDLYLLQGDLARARTLLAEAQGVQPANSFVAKLHSQDEYRHGRILVHTVRPIYAAMNDAQREFFIQSLPKGLDAFGAHDFSTWTAILKHVGVDDAEAIISDCIAAGPGRLVRDWSALVQLGRELGIAERVAELEPLDRQVSSGPRNRVADV